jgi:hypothetical protein
MDKTPFSKKCEIITLFVDSVGDQSWTQGFMQFYDLGIAFSIGANGNHITIHDSGKKYVEQAWEGLCELLGVDSYGNYESIEYLMEFAGATDEEG